MSEPSHVLVTRTANQAAAFSAKLRAAGFVPVEFPVIQLVPLPWKPLDEALAVLPSFDWLIFTSGNAVDFFLRRVDDLKMVLDNLPAVAAVGSATARRLRERAIGIDYLPDEFVGTALVLGLGDLQGKEVLLPRAKIGRPEITELLQAHGASLTEVPLYDTETAVPTAEDLAALNEGFAVITFTSPSSVRNFCKIVADQSAALEAAFAASLREALILCIGPVTAKAAQEAGFTNPLMPDEYTIDGMVQRLKAALLEKVER